mgnify:CR=1 FL=1|jgi:hypothetical protein
MSKTDKMSEINKIVDMNKINNETNENNENNKITIYVVTESEKYKLQGKIVHAYDIKSKKFSNKKEALSYACKKANKWAKIYKCDDKGEYKTVPFDKSGYYIFRNPKWKYFEYYCVSVKVLT